MGPASLAGKITKERDPVEGGEANFFGRRQKNQNPSSSHVFNIHKCNSFFFRSWCCHLDSSVNFTIFERGNLEFAWFLRKQFIHTNYILDLKSHNKTVGCGCNYYMK